MLEAAQRGLIKSQLISGHKAPAQQLPYALECQPVTLQHRILMTMRAILSQQRRADVIWSANDQDRLPALIRRITFA